MIIVKKIDNDYRIEPVRVAYYRAESLDKE